MELTFESLGLSKEDVAERVVETIAERILKETTYDEDGDPKSFPSKVEKTLRELVQERVNKRVEEIAEAEIIPKLTDYIDNLTFTKTNSYGEPKAAPQTLREYLTEKAEKYLTEDVNYNGKTKSEEGYNWSKNTTRILYLVREHLQYEVKTVLEKALKEANSQIAGGIQGAIKISLEQILAGIKVGITVGR